MEISFIEPPAPDEVEIPEQKEHFQLPARFGAIPLDEAPLGWKVETRRRETKVTKFRHAYPIIRLPFQEVQRIEFGHNAKFLADNEKAPKLRALFPTGANRLFFGDNLHVMRQLPSNSIDLIYIDPPFFSGRHYNVIFGDRNEVRSFSDIWEGGLPGYLVWLNVRLYEMKRLLKDTGNIFVHLDWHAVHYVKVEMDKLFSADCLLNEIVWGYEGTGSPSKLKFANKHDTILRYARSRRKAKAYELYYDQEIDTSYSTLKRDSDGRYFRIQGLGDYTQASIKRLEKEGRIYVSSSGKKYLKHWIESRDGKLFKKKKLGDVWTDITQLGTAIQKEKIGYPTQKPERLLERIIRASTEKGMIVADFFCGGGTTATVAQRLDRRWIACDQSRIAVAITADRVTKVVQEKVGAMFPVPDFTVEHWGVYEAPKLETYSEIQFREFVVKAFGGRPESVSPAIHGVRHGVPLYVGEPSRRSRIGKGDVARFAKAVYEERRANHGVMLAWNFGLDARKAAEILAARENKRIDFVRLNLIRLESDEFREHVVKKHKDYAPLLSFIQPPEVRVAVRRVGSLTYELDVSESVSLNKDGTIANVQWDFDHKPGRFTSTQGYTFMRAKKTKRPVLVVEYTFPKKGGYTVACSIQDDQGGERTVVQIIEVD